jgi:predicted small lipoprotein YifL
MRDYSVTDGRLIARLAVLGALAAALTVAGCGRKGPLDAPPSAAIDAPASAAPAAAAGTQVPSGQQARVTHEGQALAPPGEKKPVPLLDWLLN